MSTEITVYKVGKRIAPSIPPDRGIASMFTPTLSGFNRYYLLDHWIHATAAPLFVFHTLEDALSFYQKYLKQFHYLLAIYECSTTQLLDTPPFLPPKREWTIWDDFWMSWHDGNIGMPDEWVDGTSHEHVLTLPKGTALCSDLLPVRFVDTRDPQSHTHKGPER
jgi:hypothetical protein